jgi:hypothetical protein
MMKLEPSTKTSSVELPLTISQPEEQHEADWWSAVASIFVTFDSPRDNSR